jgi:DNA-binding MarR family transcriptional regulator
MTKRTGVAVEYSARTAGGAHKARTAKSSQSSAVPQDAVTDAERREIKDLATQFLHLMPHMHRSRPQKQINESMRGEHFIIQYINLQGRKVQPSEISEEMEISTARVAAALNGLEKKGLVRREIDPSDRRRILVDLTDEGHRRADEISDHMVRGVYLLFENLGLEDSRDLLRLVGRITDFMEHHHRELDETYPLDSKKKNTKG